MKNQPQPPKCDPPNIKPPRYTKAPDLFVAGAELAVCCVAKHVAQLRPRVDLVTKYNPIRSGNANKHHTSSVEWGKSPKTPYDLEFLPKYKTEYF